MGSEGCQLDHYGCYRDYNRMNPTAASLATLQVYSRVEHHVVNVSEIVGNTSASVRRIRTRNLFSREEALRAKA